MHKAFLRNGPVGGQIGERRMKKRIVASLLCMAMVLGSLAGCGSQGTSGGSASTQSAAASAGETAEASSEAASGTKAAAGDMVTLSLYIPTLAPYTDEAIAEVQDAINEHLAENYGIQTKLVYTEIGNFEKAINLAMTTDELDVTCYFTGSGQLSNYINNGQLLDITDYFNNASEKLKNSFTEAEITSSSMNGRMYGLVRKYQYGGKEVAVLNKEIVEEMGIDPASITDMDSLGEVLYKVHEAHPEIYTLVPQSMNDMTWHNPWVGGIGLTSFAYTNDIESTKLQSIFELDSFREFCNYTHQWYQDGLIMSDAISNTQEGSSMVTAGAAFATLHNADIDPLDTIYPNTVISATIIEPKAVPTDIGNLQYGISTNSAHPDEAFTLLSALYTDSKLHTLLSYGIEGKHYVINDDGRADYPEGMTAETEPYGGFAATATYPNYLLNPLKETAVVDDYKTSVDEWNAKVKVSKTFGFYFDTSEYGDFITAYKNLEEKYLHSIKTGSVALDDVLPTIQSELEAIGFYEVIAKMQEELDAYLAKQ